MRAEHGVIKGNIEVTEDFELHGILDGSAIVYDQARFMIYGIVDGNVTVRIGGRADVRGTVNGIVTNKGGTLRVYGTINGELRQEAGRTTVDPKAAINP